MDLLRTEYTHRVKIVIFILRANTLPGIPVTIMCTSEKPECIEVWNEVKEHYPKIKRFLDALQFGANEIIYEIEKIEPLKDLRLIRHARSSLYQVLGLLDDVCLNLHCSGHENEEDTIHSAQTLLSSVHGILKEINTKLPY